MALALSQRGARLVISYRTSKQEAQETIAQIQQQGGEAVAFRVDIASPGEVKRLMDRIDRHFGRLDVLINSAALFHRTPWQRLSARDWDVTLKTNLTGPFLCTLHASRLMLKHGGGKIINLADWAAVRPYRHYLPYCVSKSGVIGLTRALAVELAPSIQVNAIAPGPILPPPGMSAKARRRIAQRVPLRRWGNPRDIANAVVFLIEGTDFMTGSTIVLDGGQLLA
jgi:NAD(P)-dependent dehydrogenase (short-subunit alcohol dehydrogenase family)